MVSASADRAAGTGSGSGTTGTGTTTTVCPTSPPSDSHTERTRQHTHGRRTARNANPPGNRGSTSPEFRGPDGLGPAHLDALPEHLTGSLRARIRQRALEQDDPRISAGSNIVTEYARSQGDPVDYSLRNWHGWLTMVHTPRRERPPLLSMKQLLNLQPKVRVQYRKLRATWHSNLGPVVTREVQRISDEFDLVVNSNQQDASHVRGAVALSAYPGTGKTTATLWWARNHHIEQNLDLGDVTADGFLRLPVVWLPLNGSTTPLGLYRMLLQFYGWPTDGTLDRLEERTARAVMQHETTVIIVDDIHFLNMYRSADRNASSHFKAMANTLPVTFMFIGVELEAHHLLTEGLGLIKRGSKGAVTAGSSDSAQTASRWTPLSMMPFTLHRQDDRRDWKSVLETFEREMVLCGGPLDGALTSEEMREYLYARTGGHFGSLHSLLYRAAYIATGNEGKEQLTKDVLNRTRIDAAADARHSDLLAMFDGGHLTTDPDKPDLSPPTPAAATHRKRKGRRK